MSFLWGNTANQQTDKKKFANISDDQINSNQQAVPVKYLAGRNYIAGDFISPAYNPRTVPVKSQAGKGQSTTTGYKYFADFALVFCTGGRHPVDGVRTVIVDSDIRWSGTINRGARDYEPIAVQDLGTIYLYWGTETQPVDSKLLNVRPAPIGDGDKQDSTTWAANTGANTYGGLAAGDTNPYSGHYDQHPAYRGQCYGIFKDWKLGRDRTSVPNIQLELVRGCPFLDGNVAPAEDRGVNPIAVLYDWLTDTRFGMALPDSYLGRQSFYDAYLALEAVQGRISPMISQQSDFRQAIAELLEYFDGWIRRNGTRIEVGMWKTGSIAPGPTLLDNDLLAEPELTPEGWGPTLNETTVVYKDRQHHYNDYVQVYRDANNFRVTGGPRPTTLSRPYITDAGIAKQYARTIGAASAMPFTQGDLTVKREWLTNNNMLPGMVFTYNSGFYGLSFLMRLLEVEHEADKSAEAKMTVQWERSRWPRLYVPPGFQGPGGFVLGPRAIWQSRITEIPYLIEDQKFDTQVVCLAVRGNVEVQGFRVWVSFDGSTYQILPSDSSSSSFSFFGRLDGPAGPPPGNYNGRMSDSIGTMGFTLYGIGHEEVVSQSGAQWNDDNLLCFIDGEVLSVGAITTYAVGFRTAAIKRGRFGTIPAQHEGHSPIYFIYRSDLRLLDNAGFTPGTAVWFKLQPFTADLDYDLAGVTALSYTIIGFQDVPPPVLSPAPGVFVANVNVSVSNPPSGFKARYTRDGTAVSASSNEWPGAPPPYATINLSATTTVRARFYGNNGQVSQEVSGAYTKVATLPGGNQPCSAPSWSFSGVLKHTDGILTLTQTTPASSIHWSVNGGTNQIHSSPATVTLLCRASTDTIEFWATASGMDESQHIVLDNTKETTYGGGGHWPPRNPP